MLFGTDPLQLLKFAIGVITTPGSPFWYIACCPLDTKNKGKPDHLNHSAVKFKHSLCLIGGFIECHRGGHAVLLPLTILILMVITNEAGPAENHFRK